MKILVSAVALAIALGWPGVGEAQSKKSKTKAKGVTTSQHYVRHAKVGTGRVAPRPCAARTWAGCQGWDPDPQIRSMIRLDAGKDDEP